MDEKRQVFEYLLGVFHGDGNIKFNYYKNKRSSPAGINITVGKNDENYADILLNLINISFPKVRVKKKIYKDNVIRIYFYNSLLAKLFLKYKNNKHWKLPKILYPSHYIAGLWDTDGYVGSKRKLKLELTNKHDENQNLLRIVKPILENMGFKPKINIKQYYKKNVIFKDDKICFCSKEDIIKFSNAVPLRHPRKIMNLNIKLKTLENIKSVRKRKEMLNEILKHLSVNKMTSAEIAKSLNKKCAAHITKDLFNYYKIGLIKRSKINKKLVYEVA